ncbi:putative gustatory receptor 22f [Drosophila teissieri]|uniref:putative gustatory receptor 22f n=1 Tax=Drosophila teissieri TaxID=7243 RepID=UPI001CB9F6E3|nr:putative gustatory receptor 22f [Drosophila teissieri]
MFQPRRGFSCHLAWFMLQTTLYASWLLGLFPFTFDSRRRQLKRSRWLLLYGFILHSCAMCLVLSSYLAVRQRKKKNAFDRNPLLELIYLRFAHTVFFSIGLLILMNVWKSNTILKIANELLNLECQVKDHLTLKNCPNFNCFLINKCVTALGQIIIAVLFCLWQENSYPKILKILCCLPLLGCQLIIMHFHTEIILVYRYVWLLNETLQDSSKLSCSRIRALTSLYDRLLQLSETGLATNDTQLILLLTIYLIGNTVQIFFLIVLGVSMNQRYIYLMASPQLLLNFWDFWLNVVVCDLTEKCGDRTSKVLKQFTDLQHHDEELERSLNEFAWLCTHRKFRFQLCGLFPINYNMGFQIIITSFLYVLYLVQFDFMNL